ncbi:MAG: NAD-binding protein [bacterium]|nr:NAD-binding protein [bacterium]
MKKIGFVGIGLMGEPMSRNLMKAGYELFIYNRTASKCDALKGEGATVCATPKEVGANCELVFTCVGDAPDVEEVILGENGVAQGMRSGGIIVDCTTSSPALAREMHAKLKEKGVGVLDAPVSGGPEGAKLGTLSIMVGGDEDVFARAKPVLEAVGKTITHIGPAGAGQITKSVNQIVLAINMMGIAEGIILAQKSGLDPAKVLEAVGGGAAGSWIMPKRGPLMIDEKFETPFFKLGHHTKDMRIATDWAKEIGANLELAQRLRQMMEPLVAEGKFNFDHSALFIAAKRANE